MRRILLAAAALAAFGSLTVAPLDSAEAKPKWKGGKHGAMRGGPPPWAPAHGYRRKQRQIYGYRRGYYRY